MLSTELLLTYIPCKSVDEAKALAKLAIEQKLAACANIIPQIYSLYTWDQKLCDDTETPLLLKTHRGVYAALEAMITKHHSYSVPCILQLTPTSINAPYEAWLMGNLGL